MIFIGCSDPSTLKVQISRDFIFEENNRWKWNEMKENPHKTSFSSRPELLIDFGDGEGAYEVSTCADLVDQSQYSQISDDQRAEKARLVQDIYDEASPILSNEEDCMLPLEEPSSFQEEGRCLETRHGRRIALN